MTRDATLKSLTKIANNSGSKDRQLIAVTNLTILIPRMFDLLHKAQRTIHLNTLEALVSMVTRYPQQFQSVAPSIFKEITPFINDNDMQASALALKVATPAITISAINSNEAQEFIFKAALISRSHLIQG